MPKEVKRGFVDSDEIEFNDKNMKILKEAQKDVSILLDRGYSIKSVITFVGNHYLLSERQRLALTRATSPTQQLLDRKERQLESDLVNKTIHLDGLNLIITLEVALSHSILLYCMDETIRDLAGLRGTYRLIDKTDQAIELICDELLLMKIGKAIVYLDSPVSNTGRLKQRIEMIFGCKGLKVEVILTSNPDVILENLDYVVSSDSIILNKCKSWINLCGRILNARDGEYKLLDLRGIE